jgi:hypothetical protein
MIRLMIYEIDTDVKKYKGSRYGNLSTTFINLCCNYLRRTMRKIPTKTKAIGHH